MKADMTMRGHAKVSSAKERGDMGRNAASPAVHHGFNSKPRGVGGSMRDGREFEGRHSPDLKPVTERDTVHERGAVGGMKKPRAEKATERGDFKPKGEKMGGEKMAHMGKKMPKESVAIKGDTSHEGKRAKGEK